MTKKLPRYLTPFFDGTISMSDVTFRVELQKEQLVFAAAHFITFAGDICECLHGSQLRRAS